MQIIFSFTQKIADICAGLRFQPLQIPDFILSLQKNLQPLGTIYVKHVKDSNGKIKSDIRLPEGIVREM